VAAHLDHGSVAHAHSQDEPVLVGPRERHGRGVRGPGVAHEDVGDAGSYDQTTRGTEEHRGVGEGLPALGLAEPQRRVAQLLDLGRRLLSLGGWHGVESRARDPEADLSSQHRRIRILSFKGLSLWLRVRVGHSLSFRAAQGEGGHRKHDATSFSWRRLPVGEDGRLPRTPSRRSSQNAPSETF
jgi:hypothetical protein